MSPYFDKKYVDKFMKEINLMKEKFDKEKNEFVLKEVPHKPRPFVFK